MAISQRQRLIHKINCHKDALTDFEYKFSQYRLGIGDFQYPSGIEDAAKFFSSSEEELLQIEKRITRLVFAST